VLKPAHRTPPLRPRPQRVQTSLTRLAFIATRINRTDVAMEMPTVRAFSRTKTSQGTGMVAKPQSTEKGDAMLPVLTQISRNVCKLPVGLTGGRVLRKLCNAQSEEACHERERKLKLVSKTRPKIVSLIVMKSLTKIIVTMVKRRRICPTVSMECISKLRGHELALHTLPCLALCSDCSLANRASQALACFCFKSRRWLSCPK
jgi:hypothetical protein